MVNSLLNSGGGMLYIHVETKDLSRIDEQLDTMLMTLIPDGSSFGDNYERKVDTDENSDENHVIYRVKARYRPLSTLDFKTKTSTNTGLKDLTHQQMQTTLKRLREPQQQNQQQHNSPLHGTTLKRGRLIDRFHESTNTEAKSVEHKPKKVTTGLKLVTYAWTELKLPERITSFSKEEKGGYYFLGISEEEIPAQPPRNGKTRTGKFLCEGVPLPNDEPYNEHDNFRKHLQDKINKEMLWCKGPDMNVVEPSDIEGQATVKFRGLEQSSRCIIEVMVKTFFGLCFTDPEGPEAYEFKHPSNPTKSQPWRIPFGDWLKHQPSLVDIAAGV